MRTLPRKGEPDPSLKDDLIGTTDEHDTIRGQVIGWALAMDRDASIAALNDPEFKQQRIELQAYTDPVSLFIDECLEPENQLVAVEYRKLLMLAFQAWCADTGHSIATRSYTEHTLINQIRKVLPATHRPRRSLNRQECEERGLDYNKRPKLPAADWGYRIRPGLLRQHPFHPRNLELISHLRSEGGISSILKEAQLPNDETIEQERMDISKTYPSCLGSDWSASKLLETWDLDPE